MGIEFSCDSCNTKMLQDSKKIWCPHCGRYFEINWILKTAEKLKGLRLKSQLTVSLREIDKNEN